LQLATNERVGLEPAWMIFMNKKVNRKNTIKLVNKLILENIMREDPLKEVLNVGIRIEKLNTFLCCQQEKDSDILSLFIGYCFYIVAALVWWFVSLENKIKFNQSPAE
jgi:hypothetical protein